MAEMASRTRENLPDSAFACPEKRLYPHHHADGSLDMAHLRNALSRIGDPSNDQCGKAHLEAHARAEGMGQHGKALLPIKAQVLDPEEHEAWFAGRVGRRLLAIPFGGPIPSPKSRLGVDLDGEFFDETTDLTGEYKALRESNERLVDWHHGVDGVFRRTTIGKAVLDSEPEADGWWETVWLKAGEARLKLIKRLAERGAQLFGSSEAAYKKADRETGHIQVWPYILQTLTTSPQNTYSVLRPFKAALQDAESAEIDLDARVKALMADLTALSADLSPTSLVREETASAGRVSEFFAAIERLEDITRT